ncbi:hypothetical protein AQZ49_06540 [Novosphingobium sp. FSW06-99]|nr:hypothetical protein AQZ49_06540 [Novosphingobium sp. FSW06-99]
MLRIPGTRNLKPKYDRPWVKLLSFSAAQQRLPTSLAEIRPIAPKAAIIGSADLTGLDSKEIIQRYRKHLELRARTLTMATRAIYPDRSDAIFIIVSAFVLAGATDAEIVCVILANPHFLEKHGDNQPMAEREVVTIRAKVEAGR